MKKTICFSFITIFLFLFLYSVYLKFEDSSNWVAHWTAIDDTRNYTISYKEQPILIVKGNSEHMFTQYGGFFGDQTLEFTDNSGKKILELSINPKEFVGEAHGKKVKLKPGAIVEL